MKKCAMLILGIVIFFATGCAGANNLVQADKYIGITEIELIRQMGTPHRHYSAGGSNFLTYEIYERKVLKGMHSAHMPGLPPLMTGEPARVIHKHCTATFEVAGGRVVNLQAEGDTCLAN
jgi:hypothetical protein